MEINDLNGDSIPEIAIGETGYVSYGTNKGAVWIAFPDSTGTVKEAKLVTEGSSLLYSPLATSDNYGVSLSNYLDNEGNFHLMAGMSAKQENTAAEGAVLRMELISIPTSLSVSFTSNSKYYVNTRKEIDGGYYLTNNGKLNVRYEGEYDSSYPLKFKVYNQVYDVVATDAMTSILGTVNTQSFGENFYTFNFATVPLTFNQFYILEITNQKNEKEFLRFKYAPFVITGTPK